MSSDKTYLFERSVTVDGVAYAAGDTVAGRDLHPGRLASCLRVGHVVEYTAPAPDQLLADTPTETAEPESTEPADPETSEPAGESTGGDEPTKKAKKAKK